ncbi:hypothetical protein QF026_002848 [Streptomyces aurantiacus]|nr:hypothetical protein [Streptomyces aurantiacus]
MLDELLGTPTGPLSTHAEEFAWVVAALPARSER